MNRRRLNALLRSLPSVVLGLAVAWLPLSAAVAATATDLRADSASVNGRTGEVLYRGNALLSQENVDIRADEMSASQNADGSLKSGFFRGQPAILLHRDPVTGASTEARANEIMYDTGKGLIELKGNATLSQDDPIAKRQITLNADQIAVTERNNQLTEIQASGSPATFSRQEAEALPIEGRANRLQYVGDREFLQLDGNALLAQGKTTFEHVVIEYDGQRELITAPKRDGSQVKITRMPETNAEAGPGTPANEPKPINKPINKDTP